MTVVGAGYIFGTNIVLGRCGKCCEYICGQLAQPLVMRCPCGTTEMEKPPLYYLIHTGTNMIIYKLSIANTDTHTEKIFIGVIFTSDLKNPDKKVESEINYIRDFRNFKISTELKNDLLKGLSGHPVIEYEILSTPRSMVAGVIDEKLYINKYNSLAPHGYNQCYMVETLMKKGKIA